MYFPSVTRNNEFNLKLIRKTSLNLSICETGFILFLNLIRNSKSDSVRKFWDLQHYCVTFIVLFCVYMWLYKTTVELLPHKKLKCIACIVLEFIKLIVYTYFVPLYSWQWVRMVWIGCYELNFFFAMLFKSWIKFKYKKQKK